jgi:hypothetical protein
MVFLGSNTNLGGQALQHPFVPPTVLREMELVGTTWKVGN